MQKLQHEQRKKLEKRVKQTRDVHERNRICVILARDEGCTIETIVRILRLSKESILHYIREYNSEGKTCHDPRGGSECKLNVQQLTELLFHLEKVTYVKADAICAYVEKTFGVKYSAKGMIKLLHRNKFVYKKPLKIPTRLCPKNQEEFIQKYEKLKAQLSTDEEIYFMDAVHPEYQSQAVFGWIRKGVRKTLQSTAQQTRLHFVGGINLDTMDANVYEYDKVNSESVIDFFKKLEANSQASTIHVVLDNARSNRNKDVAKYVDGSRIRLHYLPPYSPNLNPIERLWKVMREFTTYNTYYDKFILFAAKIREFIHNLANIKKLLKSRITDTFQKININPVYVSR